MRRSIMAIMDQEQSYAVRFMDHVNRKNTVPFEVRAFTDTDSLKACLEKRRVDILLLSEKMPDEELEAKLRAWPIRLICRLTESPESGAGDSSRDADWSGSRAEEKKAAWPKIYKYQASSAILKEVMELYANSGDLPGKESDGTLIKPKTRTVGIFSPVGRTMKTALAMTLGEFLAGKKPTLVINMEACSGLFELCGRERQGGISDLIYYIRQGEKDLMPKMLPLIAEYRGISLLPPFESAEELYGMKPDEWTQLLTAIRRESTFEVLILDMGEVPLVFPELLEECDVIYMPEVRKDLPSSAKMREFALLLDTAGLTGIKERFRRVRMPEKLPPAGDSWFESLRSSPVAKVAAECAERDHLC